MAKHPPGKGGNAHIRLIVLDAIIPEGDFGQIAQALQNALRPTATIPQRTGAPAPQIIHQDAAAFNGADAEEAETEDAAAEQAVVPRTPRDSKPRKISTPDMIELTAEEVASWKEFAGAKVPKSDNDRYILAAAWFKENGADDGVTADHVYTCFRHMKWSVGKKDFGSPMRALKKAEQLRSVGTGKFIITQLGLQRIDDMDLAS